MVVVSYCPFVNSRIGPDALKSPVHWKMMRVERVGQISGKTMRNTSVSVVQPSIRADSMISSGIRLMAPLNRRMLVPNPVQMQ